MNRVLNIPKTPKSHMLPIKPTKVSMWNDPITPKRSSCHFSKSFDIFSFSNYKFYGPSFINFLCDRCWHLQIENKSQTFKKHLKYKISSKKSMRKSNDFFSSGWNRVCWIIALDKAEFEIGREKCPIVPLGNLENEASERIIYNGNYCYASVLSQLWYFTYSKFLCPVIWRFKQLGSTYINNYFLREKGFVLTLQRGNILEVYKSVVIFAVLRIHKGEN